MHDDLVALRMAKPFSFCMLITFLLPPRVQNDSPKKHQNNFIMRKN